MKALGRAGVICCLYSMLVLLTYTFVYVQLSSGARGLAFGMNRSIVGFYSLHPSQPLFCHAGTGLPGLNQY